MREAVAQMFAKYDWQRVEDTTRALREILQELALLGLWRAKFFEKAAFYGGTALRILYGLDRFSEDLDFSLLQPMPDFELERYSSTLERELAAFGFEVRVEQKGKAVETAVQSAFLKADTANELLVIQAGEHILRQIPAGQVTRIKIEVDTDPPPGFATENRFLLLPIPFSVRSYRLPDLFAGKMHAVLCRRWKNRVKGRDWYDLVWYCAHHPELNLAHLEQRMRQRGHWEGSSSLGPEDFQTLIAEAIGRLNVDQARGGSCRSSGIRKRWRCGHGISSLTWSAGFAVCRKLAGQLSRRMSGQHFSGGCGGERRRAQVPSRLYADVVEHGSLGAPGNRRESSGRIRPAALAILHRASKSNSR